MLGQEQEVIGNIVGRRTSRTNNNYLLRKSFSGPKSQDQLVSVWTPNFSGKRTRASLATLIAQAILSQEDGRARLKTIYEWLMTNQPNQFRQDHDAWKNSVRHNLTINKAFQRVPRTEYEFAGKGGFWTILPEYRPLFELEIAEAQRAGNNSHFNDVNIKQKVDKTQSKQLQAFDAIKSAAILSEIAAKQQQFQEQLLREQELLEASAEPAPSNPITAVYSSANSMNQPLQHTLPTQHSTFEQSQTLPAQTLPSLYYQQNLADYTHAPVNNHHYTGTVEANYQQVMNNNYPLLHQSNYNIHTQLQHYPAAHHHVAYPQMQMYQQQQYPGVMYSHQPNYQNQHQQHNWYHEGYQQHRSMHPVQYQQEGSSILPTEQHVNMAAAPSYVHRPQTQQQYPAPYYTSLASVAAQENEEASFAAASALQPPTQPKI